jgi:hypothetical protein
MSDSQKTEWTCPECDWHGPLTSLMAKQYHEDGELAIGYCPSCGTAWSSTPQAIVLFGSLSAGYEAYGPFASKDEATEFCDNEDLTVADTVIIELKKPEDF